MLQKIKSTYGEIAKYFPELKSKVPSSRHKKQILLSKAGGRKPRPSVKNHLGTALSNYTRKSSLAYDPIFDKKIRRLRPDWFVSQSEKADQKKRLLLRMTKKPGHDTALGRSLRHYSSKSSPVHDPIFDKKIRRLRPDWFISTSEKNKLLLVEMARKGKARPSRKTYLGMSLGSYTAKSHHCHDPVFTKQIKKLAPHWFRKCSKK